MISKSFDYSYWRWLFGSESGEPGYLKFKDRWLIAHGIVGVLLSALVPGTLRDASNAVLLPLAGTLIGLSFAWGGNASALLQTEEMEALAAKNPNGIEEYLYTYQSAILVLLATLSLWGLAGLGVFELFGSLYRWNPLRLLGRALVFSLLGLTVRECWHVVLGAQLMLLTRYKLRSSRPKGESSSGKGG